MPAMTHSIHRWTHFSHAILRIFLSLVSMSPSIPSAATLALTIFSLWSCRDLSIWSPTSAVLEAIWCAELRRWVFCSPLATPLTRALRCLPATSASVAFSPYLAPSLDSSRSCGRVGDGDGQGRAGVGRKVLGESGAGRAGRGRGATGAYRLRLSALLRRHLR